MHIRSPLHTAMGNNGGTRMNLLGESGKPITEEYKEKFGEVAYAEFDKEEYIKFMDRKHMTKVWRTRGNRMLGEHGSHA